MIGHACDGSSTLRHRPRAQSRAGAGRRTSVSRVVVTKVRRCRIVLTKRACGAPDKCEPDRCYQSAPLPDRSDQTCVRGAGRRARHVAGARHLRRARRALYARVTRSVTHASRGASRTRHAERYAKRYAEHALRARSQARARCSAAAADAAARARIRSSLSSWLGRLVTSRNGAPPCARTRLDAAPSAARAGGARRRCLLYTSPSPRD